MTIQEAIKQMAAAGAELYCKVCTVDSVDEDARTVDCSPLDEGAPLLGVNLQANQESEHGVVVFPSVGSYVVVAFLNHSAALVVASEKIDKIRLKIGDTTAEIVDGQIDIAIKETKVKLTDKQADIAVKDTTIEASSEGVVINGGDFGGLIKIQQLTDKINDLIDAFNSHTHEIPSGSVAVTGSATAQANPAPVSVPAIMSPHTKVQVSDYENEKVKH